MHACTRAALAVRACRARVRGRHCAFKRRARARVRAGTCCAAPRHALCSYARAPAPTAHTTAQKKPAAKKTAKPAAKKTVRPPRPRCSRGLAGARTPLTRHAHAGGMHAPLTGGKEAGGQAEEGDCEEAGGEEGEGISQEVGRHAESWWVRPRTCLPRAIATALRQSARCARCPLQAGSTSGARLTHDRALHTAVPTALFIPRAVERSQRAPHQIGRSAVRRFGAGASESLRTKAAHPENTQVSGARELASSSDPTSSSVRRRDCSKFGRLPTKRSVTTIDGGLTTLPHGSTRHARDAFTPLARDHPPDGRLARAAQVRAHAHSRAPRAASAATPRLSQAV